MRYVVIGAGAIGAGVGGLLDDSGSEVLLVARGEHLAAMREHGLTVRMPDGVITRRPDVAASPEEVELRTDDVLVLATKTHQAAAALATWVDAPVHDGGQVVGTAGERLPLLTALNGVASEEIALRWFARVYGVCVWMPAVLARPGEIIVRCAPVRAILHAARYPAVLADDGDAAFLRQLAEDWGRAGIQVPTPDDVMPWKYRKLLGNLGNAVQALLGDGGLGQDITEAARTEAAAIYEAAGITMNSDESERHSRDQLTAAPVAGAPERMGGSTWQSLHRGSGSAETDYLNGEIVAIAHRLGRTAPVNAALAELVRHAAAQRTKPGVMTPDELGQRVLGQRPESIG
ncbi:ketopantoate reductase family protein [Occultella kanbiaonis]|uniref:ketopantoate reductase family protein n=1 Tax=Occultella kanbiaonis TaxID=2675754 RepID=UPI00143D0D96|nr:2-dehydropantoate 2-reductase N-terminal domain-containing protein [Occultella kanbiaonis]